MLAILIKIKNNNALSIHPGIVQGAEYIAVNKSDKIFVPIELIFYYFYK